MLENKIVQKSVAISIVEKSYCNYIAADSSFYFDKGAVLSAYNCLLPNSKASFYELKTLILRRTSNDGRTHTVRCSFAHRSMYERTPTDVRLQEILFRVTITIFRHCKNTILI